jgi:hypothetical protein
MFAWGRRTGASPSKSRADVESDEPFGTGAAHTPSRVERDLAEQRIG